MQALEHRAPLLYPRQPVVSDRPQNGTDSTSIPQEAIQAEVARQLAVLDQRATARELEMSAQELEIQRLRQQIAEANAQRDQALRVAALSSAQSTARVPVPTFEQPPQVAVQSQLASVSNMPQVQGVASQAKVLHLKRLMPVGVWRPLFRLHLFRVCCRVYSPG